MGVTDTEQLTLNPCRVQTAGLSMPPGISVGHTLNITLMSVCIASCQLTVSVSPQLPGFVVLVDHTIIILILFKKKTILLVKNAYHNGYSSAVS